MAKSLAVDEKPTVVTRMGIGFRLANFLSLQTARMSLTSLTPTLSARRLQDTRLSWLLASCRMMSKPPSPGPTCPLALACWVPCSWVLNPSSAKASATVRSKAWFSLATCWLFMSEVLVHSLAQSRRRPRSLVPVIIALAARQATHPALPASPSTMAAVARGGLSDGAKAVASMVRQMVLAGTTRPSLKGRVV